MGSLTIKGLSKAFREYRHPSARLLEWFGSAPRHTLKWILQDINLDIRAGESIGVVGRNGAGKSTLLKLITGVSVPTRGNVSAEGRISALLELGMGFHPEFTGRQNAYMQSYLQGMERSEVDAVMPAIAAFAEIGDYFDKPIRIYSTGMQLRLAFSVATAVRPDILIVDEALAVGDAYFQHKCFDRIRRYRDEGTTLMFVSHDPSAVKSLCDRAVLLDKGSIVHDGRPAEVLDHYNAIIAPEAASAAIRLSSEFSHGTRSGDGKIRIEKVEMGAAGSPGQYAVVSGQPMSVRVSMQGWEHLDELTLGILIKDRLGNDVFGTNTFYLKQEIGPVAPRQKKRVTFDFPALNLGPGHYSVTLAAHSSSNHLAGNHDWWERALMFQVIPSEGPHTVGVCHLAVNCSCSDLLERD